VNVKAIASWTMLLALALCATAAPVPAPKVRERPSVVGHWVAYWSGTAWDTEFRADGGYRASRDGTHHAVGVWVLKGDKLIIEERRLYPGMYDDAVFYTYKLKPGRLDSVCGQFRLAKAR
jgi:hypothetical protein